MSRAGVDNAHGWIFQQRDSLARSLIRQAQNGDVTAVQCLRPTARVFSLVAGQGVHDKIAQGLTGRVRLGASTGVIAHLLPQALEKLAQLHPSIDVQIAVLTSRQTLERLRVGALDIGIVALPQAGVSGVTVDVWRRDAVVAFLPAHWSVPERVDPEWMAQKALILNSAGTHLSQLTRNWFSRSGPCPTPRIELDYNDAIKSLVGAGYGAALLPHEAGAPEPSADRVVIRPLQPPLWRSLGLAYRDSGMEPATSHMLSVLRSQGQD